MHSIIHVYYTLEHLRALDVEYINVFSSLYVYLLHLCQRQESEKAIKILKKWSYRRTLWKFWRLIYSTRMDGN